MASHVAEGSGTSLVHTAPAHGHDDFAIGQKNNLSLRCEVDANGCFTSAAGKGLEGISVLADGSMLRICRMPYITMLPSMF